MMTLSPYRVGLVTSERARRVIVIWQHGPSTKPAERVGVAVARGDHRRKRHIRMHGNRQTAREFILLTGIVLADRIRRLFSRHRVFSARVVRHEMERGKVAAPSLSSHSKEIDRETHISAFPAPPQKHARLSQADVYEAGARRSLAPSREGPQAHQRLSGGCL